MFPRTCVCVFCCFCLSQLFLLLPLRLRSLLLFKPHLLHSLSLSLCLWLSLSSKPNWLGQQQQHQLLLLLSCTLTFKVGWTILAQINGPTSNAAMRDASGMSSLSSAASQLLLFSRFNKILLLLQWVSDHWPHSAAATAAPKSNYAT